MENVAHKPLNTSLCIRAVYQALCYFDVFNYPLKLSEIHRFCSLEIDEADLKNALTNLLHTGKIHFRNGYYYLETSSPSIIDNRLENEDRLAKKMPRVKRYAGLVQSFPFVRAVMISGSVSKGVLNKEGDVDYFIIAEKGRVWLCRTLLILFKKIFLMNSKKYFCVNYFVDTGNLNVPDKNIFVATEIKTLIPVAENEIAREFLNANKWADDMFPNNRESKSPFFSEAKAKSIAGRIMERCFSTALGDKLDNYFFKKTLKRWQRKFSHFDEKQFDLNMRSYKSVSKHHPQGNQAKVLNALSLRMNKLEEVL